MANDIIAYVYNIHKGHEYNSPHDVYSLVIKLFLITK